MSRQANIKGWCPTDFTFKKSHHAVERLQLATNEKELFSDRVPVVLERSPVETRYPLPSGTYIAIPQTLTAHDVEATIREKAGVPAS